MIQLTEEQGRQLQGAGKSPVRLVDPQTKQEYVAVRADVYARLQELVYDDSPWTAEELDALALEAGKFAGWDDMDEYDDYDRNKS